VFAAVVDFGSNRRIVDSMRRQPGGSKPNGFISDRALHIDIVSLKLLSALNCSSAAHNKYSDGCRALDAATRHAAESGLPYNQEVRKDVDGEEGACAL
jgi:hypothetical protein